jgi:hypothetical protein
MVKRSVIVVSNAFSAWVTELEYKKVIGYVGILSIAMGIFYVFLSG